MGIVLAMTLVMTVIIMQTGAASARQDARILFDLSASQVSRQLDSGIGTLATMADLGSATAGISLAPRDQGLGHPALEFFQRSLDSNPALYAIYAGWADGSFLMLINAANDPRVLQTLRGPEGSRYILRSIVQRAGVRTQHWTFLSRDRTVLDHRSESAPDYDPRTRDWYQAAWSSAQTVIGDVYVFNSLRQPGITASRRLAQGDGVLGVDLTLAGLEHLLDQASPSAQGGIILLDGQDRLLAASSRAARWLAAAGPGGTAGASPLPAASPATPASTSGTPAATPATPGLLAPLGKSPLVGPDKRHDIGGTWYLRLRHTWEPRPGVSYHLVILAPEQEFLGYLTGLQPALVILALVTLLVAIPFSLLISRRISGMIISLARDAERVSQLDFEGSHEACFIKEFDQLGASFGKMKSDLAQRTEFLNLTLAKLERVVQLGIAMSSEKDANRLVELILQGAKELTHADGGSLYLVKDNKELAFQIVLNDTLGFAQGGTSGQAPNLPAVPLYDAEGRQNHHNVVSHAFLTGQTVNIADAYGVGDFDFSGTRMFDEKNHYRSTSFLTIPLRPLGGNVIGALQLINATDPATRRIIPFTGELQRLVEALAAEAATAIYNRQLLENQEMLFDALVQFIAGAIDTKSHYTGAHCARVPVLAGLLAQAASDQTEGPLAGFSIAGADDWREFRIAAWLHDCGKVTTPEFVVDKATKLETIYNRIHEIRTRFEVLLRDARIAALQARLDGADPAAAAAALAQAEARLHDDFAFLASCNSGDEFMSPERLDRLRRLAATTWTRHFDKRLGLSWEELSRLDGLPPETLPVQETLLADQPEHRIRRSPDSAAAYQGRNFTLPAPELLYNHGELYNLNIGRGTLTEEERFKINEHVMQTIVMLEKLPLPDNLKRVPRYAGTHHETLKGTGYPRRLDATQLDIPSRIMAIADIFEALSSSDRPYKKTKKLSECVKILHGFKKDGHIDPQLFDLFLSSGVYRRYAEQHLKPEQLDDVDIAPYLG